MQLPKTLESNQKVVLVDQLIMTGGLLTLEAPKIMNKAVKIAIKKIHV